DINGDGRLDLVAGEAWGPQSRRPGGGHALYWFEQPPNPRDRWRQHVIEDGLHKYHDQAVGDVDGDGELEILITSQIAGIVAYYDIPDDLRVSRWPYSVRHIVADDLSVEGLAIGDVNGDGANEIIAGTHIFYPPSEPGCRWERHDLDDLDRPVVALGDLNNDGVPDLVAAEGELNEGRLVWYDVYNGRKHVLADDLFHPHSLGLADFTGNGSLDIFVGEMGLGTHEKTRLIIWVNNGHGQFVPMTISEGYPTHGAQVGDVNGDGKPDIVGKPYRPGRTVDIWWNTW
ncbi:MAG TPA: VCBS repeat-containing protein, partial [Chloroflexi bacterium]|nr:VCBS repeat-containing protein [Chloroflexota bacterium]